MLKNKITPIPGLFDLKALEEKLVEQDEAFRHFTKEILFQTNPQTASAEILAEGLAVIHERLGNMLTMLLRSGGG